MPSLFWDIETRSCVDLERVGAWRYAADPTTEVLCVAFAIDEGNPELWLPGEPIPRAFVNAASDPSCSVVAHNAQFERAIAARVLAPCYRWPRIPLDRQHCTMTMALASALPGSLDGAAAALG